MRVNSKATDSACWVVFDTRRRHDGTILVRGLYPGNFIWRLQRFPIMLMTFYSAEQHEDLLTATVRCPPASEQAPAFQGTGPLIGALLVMCRPS